MKQGPVAQPQVQNSPRPVSISVFEAAFAVALVSISVAGAFAFLRIRKATLKPQPEPQPSVVSSGAPVSFPYVELSPFSGWRPEELGLMIGIPLLVLFVVLYRNKNSLTRLRFSFFSLFSSYYTNQKELLDFYKRMFQAENELAKFTKVEMTEWLITGCSMKVFRDQFEKNIRQLEQYKRDEMKLKKRLGESRMEQVRQVALGEIVRGFKDRFQWEEFVKWQAIFGSLWELGFFQRVNEMLLQFPENAITPNMDNLDDFLQGMAILFSLSISGKPRKFHHGTSRDPLEFANMLAKEFKGRVPARYDRYPRIAELLDKLAAFRENLPTEFTHEDMYELFNEMADQLSVRGTDMYLDPTGRMKFVAAAEKLLGYEIPNELKDFEHEKQLVRFVMRKLFGNGSRPAGAQPNEIHNEEGLLDFLAESNRKTRMERMDFEHLNPGMTLEGLFERKKKGGVKSVNVVDEGTDELEDEEDDEEEEYDPDLDIFNQELKYGRNKEQQVKESFHESAALKAIREKSEELRKRDAERKEEEEEE